MKYENGDYIKCVRVNNRLEKLNIQKGQLFQIVVETLVFPHRTVTHTYFDLDDERITLMHDDDETYISDFFKKVVKMGPKGLVR